MGQDEDENKTGNQSFCLFWIVAVTNEFSTLKYWFVRHRIVSKHIGTKALVLVFVFVFVLAHEQVIDGRP